MGVGFHITSGPILERKGDLAAVLTALEPHDVLFIDEIHRLNRAIEEVLYPAMEDFQLDVVLGQGPSARTLRLDLPKFTLVGATTRTGLLTTPLRARFGVFHRLNYYEPADLAAIVRRSARLLEVTIDDEGADALASRSRGTPADRQPAAAPGARRRPGARPRQRRPRGGRGGDGAAGGRRPRPGGARPPDPAPAGRDLRGAPGGARARWPTAWASRPTRSRTSTSPILLQEGLLTRTPRGRVATPRAYRHLGLTPPSDPAQTGLF